VESRVADRLSRLTAIGGAPRRPYIILGCALAAAIILAGCGATDTSTSASRGAYSAARAGGEQHIVQPGETIYHIAQVYGVSPNALMAANGISDPHDLRVGQVVVIPAGDAPTAFARSDPWSVPRADRQFAWPVAAGTVSSPFGMRHGVMHDGVDIAAPAGTPVLSADDGTVIFAGRERGYGNLVIVQHRGGYATVYGHNRRNLVSTGAIVARGQEIAEMGATGRASGPNLHFEVRYENRAQNPLAYLPQPDHSTPISFAQLGGS